MNETQPKFIFIDHPDSVQDKGFVCLDLDKLNGLVYRSEIKELSLWMGESEAIIFAGEMAEEVAHYVKSLSTQFKLKQQLETPAFRAIVEDFKDALNKVLEDEPYDDNVIDNLNSILELLDVTIEDL